MTNGGLLSPRGSRCIFVEKLVNIILPTGTFVAISSPVDRILTNGIDFRIVGVHKAGVGTVRELFGGVKTGQIAMP
jgi:hypothetical protein